MQIDLLDPITLLYVVTTLLAVFLYGRYSYAIQILKYLEQNEQTAHNDYMTMCESYYRTSAVSSNWHQAWSSYLTFYALLMFTTHHTVGIRRRKGISTRAEDAKLLTEHLFNEVAKNVSGQSLFPQIARFQRSLPTIPELSDVVVKSFFQQS